MTAFVTRNTAFLAMSLIVPVTFALVAGRYEQRIMTLAGIYAIAVLGYQLIFGRLGGLSLAQGCFFGLGAYATGLLSIASGWSFPVTFLASIVLPMGLAALVAIPVLRLDSHYFALATLGIAQVVLLTAVNWTSVTGGANGLYGVPPIRYPGGDTLSPKAMLLLVWGILAVAAAAVTWLFRGRTAYRLTLLREAPEAAASSAIDLGARRLALFVGSAGLGGAAGALQAHSIGVVSPAVTEFQVMVTILAMTVIGGRGHPAGAILGAVLLVHLPEWFRFLETNYLIAYGAALLAAVILMPEGIAGLVTSWFRRGERWQPVSTIPGNPPPSRPAGALRLDGLTKRFGGVAALDGVSLAIAPGEIIGLIGPNGSGKSTLINIASGLLHKDAGAIHLGSRDIGRATPQRIAKLGLGRTFQTPTCPVGLSVFATVLAATSDRLDEAAAQVHARFCLDRVGLSPVQDRSAGDLAPAESRRLDLARALAGTPTVLLLDEPAAGLTPGERDDLARLLREVAASGTGLLIVDHTMDFLLPMADRVVCLAAGVIVAEGLPADVVRNQTAIAAFFGTASG